MAHEPDDATQRTGLLVVAIVALALLVLFVLAAASWGMGMMGVGFGIPGMLELFVLLLILLPPIGFVVLVVVAWRYLQWRESPDPALEELRLALARGDIDEEAFERRKDLLERDR